MSYPERVNTGLKVVGDGVRLEKSVVRDGAEGVVLTTEFLLQLQCLLETDWFGWRLSAGVEQRGVSGIYRSQTSLLHLEDTHKITRNYITCCTIL